MADGNVTFKTIDTTPAPTPSVEAKKESSNIAVWAISTATLTTAGTTGNLLTKLLTVAKFLGLK